MIRLRRKLVEWMDWVGVVLIVGSYAAAVFGYLNPTHPTYLIMNLVGSATVSYSSWRKKDVQPVALNLVFVIIALLGLILYFHG